MNNMTYLEELWDKRAHRHKKKLNVIKFFICAGVALMLFSLFLPVSEATPHMINIIKNSKYITISDNVVNSNIFESISPISTISVYNALSFDNVAKTYKWALITELILFVATLSTIIILTFKKPTGALAILSFVMMIQYAFIWGISGMNIVFKIFPESYFKTGISPYVGFSGAIITLISSFFIPSCVSTNR